MLRYSDTTSVIQVQRHYRREYGEQALESFSIKRWLQQFQETCSGLHKKDEGGPTVDPDTVEVVREDVQRSPS
jgi:hypothetical protein